MISKAIESLRIFGRSQWIRKSELRYKTVQSSVALGMGTALEGLIRFARTVIVAKVLLPEQVGLIALLLAITQIFEGMTEVGINLSIIQNPKGHQKEFLNMAWWFQFVRGFGLYLLAFLLAPFIAHFYNEPCMTGMLRIAFLMVPLKSLISPRAYLLEKDLKYTTYMILYQGSIFIGMCVLIALVLVWRNAWAWVIGFTVEFALLAILSYFFCPFLPTFSFDKDSFSELLHFARGMFGLPMLVFVAFQLDIFVLGKMMPRDLIGLYAMAVVLARIPRELFMKIVGRLMLPVFSRYQDDVDSLRRMFLNVIFVTALLNSPATGFLIGCSGPLLAFAFKPDYVYVAAPFSVLCMVMFFRVQAIVLASIYMALGRPHLQRLFVAFRAVALVVLIYPCIYFGGLLGAAFAVLMAESIGFMAQLYQIRKLLTLSFSDITDRYLYGFLVVAFLILLFSLMILVLPESLLLYLIVGIFLLIPVYVLTLLHIINFFRDQIHV